MLWDEGVCWQAVPGIGGVVPCSQMEDTGTTVPPAHNPPLPPNSERDKSDNRGLSQNV